MSNMAKSLEADYAQAKPRTDNAWMLEQELKAAKRVLAVLVSKAGGKIELTPADFFNISDNTTIETSIDPQTDNYVYEVKTAS